MEIMIDATYIQAGAHDLLHGGIAEFADPFRIDFLRWWLRARAAGRWHNRGDSESMVDELSDENAVRFGRSNEPSVC